MGYYSQVKLCLKKDAYEDLRERLLKNEIYDYMFDEGFFYLTELEDDNIVICTWNEIKWYSTYKEIKIIEDYLTELDDKKIEYRFIRVGEEYNDIEFREFYGDGSCERIQIYTSIEIY